MMRDEDEDSVDFMGCCVVAGRVLGKFDLFGAVEDSPEELGG
jgi:hypothetical protein